MTKDAFLAALKANLHGLPPRTCEEILADYASHFDEGVAHGRTEGEIAAALGDPARLARELRAEAGLKRWDQERSVSAAAAAVLAILSLGAIDVLILLPILLVVIALIIAAGCAAIGLTIAGVVLLIGGSAGSHIGFIGSLAQAITGGVGFIASGIFVGALTALSSIGLSNLLIRYGRFHVRLLKPEPAV